MRGGGGGGGGRRRVVGRDVIICLFYLFVWQRVCEAFGWGFANGIDGILACAAHLV